MNAVNLDQIRIDGGTQSRETIDPATVDEYAEAMERGERFPPPVVFFDGQYAWLADGFHRYYAGKRAGVQAMDVDWREGTLEMAKLYAASANAEHGLRRTAGDKRRAIEMVLSTKSGRRWTQEQIAKHCHVTQQYVSRIRAEYNCCNPPQNPPREAEPTKAEKKRAAIAEAVTARPKASDRQIARELGVDRATVGKVRARSTPRTTATPSPAAPSPAWPQAPPPAPGREDPSDVPPPSRRYSTAAILDVATTIVDAARVACAEWSDPDWVLLLEHWNDVVVQRRPRSSDRTSPRDAREAMAGAHGAAGPRGRRDP